METGLSINIHLAEILNNDSVLSGLTEDIYPIVAPEKEDEDVKYPFVLHLRENTQAIDTKQILVGDTVTFAIAVVSDKYGETVEIAERVRQLLEKRRDGYFQNCQLISASEDYQYNAYVQRLRFSATIFRQ